MYDDYYEMYQKDLEKIEPYGAEEGQELAALSLRGDTVAKTRLIEGGLHQAFAYAKEYEGRGLQPGDLIQEANMGLTMAAVSYEGGSWQDYSEHKIRQAVEDALEEYGAEMKAEETVLARVNVLKEVSEVMAEELGREPSAEELAGRMKMSEDEIKDIMKVTLDALSVGGE